MKIKKLFLPSGKLLVELKYFNSIYNDYTFHSHTNTCFCFIKKGSLKVKYSDNERYIKSKDSVFVFNAKQIHKIENIDAKGYYVLFIDDEWVKKVGYKMFGKSVIFKHETDFSQEINDIFINFCEKILINDEVNIEQKLYKIIKKIYYSYKKKQVSYEKQNLMLSSIDEFIYSNISKKVSTSSIAMFLGYNKSYFIREFKKRVGITPNNYIINRKIEAAKTQILTKIYENNISLLSHELGFYDQSHLNRNFKKIYGISPSKYI